MLTVFKQIFTWWNQQTFGTRLQIFFSGKLVGEDKNGNKYYESKSGRRWVIYNGEVEACLLYTSPSPRDATLSRMPSSA